MDEGVRAGPSPWLVAPSADVLPPGVPPRTLRGDDPVTVEEPTRGSGRPAGAKRALRQGVVFIADAVADGAALLKGASLTSDLSIR